MINALEKWILLQEAVPATHPDMIAPTIETRSNLRVIFCCWPIESNLSMLSPVIAVAAPTAERIVFMIVRETMLPLSLSAVIVPALPALKNSQSQKRMKQPPTISSIEAG